MLWMAHIRAGRKVVPPHLRGKRAQARVTKELRDAESRSDLATFRRSKAVLMCLDGKNTAQIAEALYVGDSTVSKWLTAYVERGFEGLRLRVAPGAQSRLSAQQLEELGEIIDAGPEAAGFSGGIWTALLVRQLIAERYGITYNWKYVPELLHRMGFSVQRPRKRLSRADHEAQEYWLRVRLPEIKKPRRKSTA